MIYTYTNSKNDPKTGETNQSRKHYPLHFPYSLSRKRYKIIKFEHYCGLWSFDVLYLKKSNNSIEDIKKFAKHLTYTWENILKTEKNSIDKKEN